MSKGDPPDDDTTAEGGPAGRPSARPASARPASARPGSARASAAAAARSPAAQRTGSAPRPLTGEGGGAVGTVAAQRQEAGRTGPPGNGGAGEGRETLPAVVGAGGRTSRTGETPSAPPSERAAGAAASTVPARPRPVLPERSRPARKPASRAAALAAALDAPMEPEADEPSRLDLALKVLLRLAGVAWLLGAVVLWGRLVGALGDTITPAWHDPAGPWLTTLTAAVVFPVVAVGLWLQGRWGVVVWVSAVAAEVVLLVTAAHLLPFGAPALAANVVAIAAAGAIAVVRQIREGDGG